LAVFAVAFFVISFRAGSAGIASGYVDPISHIAAQDESLYTHSAIRMATEGDWLTPRFLGRFALYKPPLLYWLSGVSIKLFGIHAFAIRLPEFLAAAAIATLVFWMVQSAFSTTAAFGAFLLTISDPLWHILGRLNLTDMILALCITAAAACLHVDPALRRRGPFLLFGIATGAAIMTKGIAGALPLVLLGVFTIAAPPRIGMARALQLLAVVAIVAAPWHVYQFVVHRRWFWAEYVLTEHLSFGLGAPPQTSSENQLWFYVRRMFLLDPLLLCLAVFAIPFWIKTRRAEARLLLAWVVTIGCAVLAFQYRNIAYLLPAIPALAIASAPLLNSKLLVCVLLPALFIAKTYYADRPWGLSYRAGELASAPALRRYCELQRGNGLIIVSTDDEFYSAVLPLDRVRYVFITPPGPQRRYPLDFRDLGIAIPASEFNTPQWEQAYSRRLHDWGLPTEEALGTVVLARNNDEIAAIIAAHPESDFNLPETLVPSMPDRERQVVGNRVFLLSKTAVPGKPRHRSCLV
jgi:hypothetical protein